MSIVVDIDYRAGDWQYSGGHTFVLDRISLIDVLQTDVPSFRGKGVYNNSGGYTIPEGKFLILQSGNGPTPDYYLLPALPAAAADAVTKTFVGEGDPPDPATETLDLGVNSILSYNYRIAPGKYKLHDYMGDYLPPDMGIDIVGVSGLSSVVPSNPEDQVVPTASISKVRNENSDEGISACYRVTLDAVPMLYRGLPAASVTISGIVYTLDDAISSGLIVAKAARSTLTTDYYMSYGATLDAMVPSAISLDKGDNPAGWIAVSCGTLEGGSYGFSYGMNFHTWPEMSFTMPENEAVVYPPDYINNQITVSFSF